MKHPLTILSRYAAVVAALAFAVGTPQTLAAGVLDVGFVDQGALAGVPAFQSANRQLADYNNQLQRQFADQVRRLKSQQEQGKLAQQFQQKLGERRAQIFQPLFAKAQVAIASVASSKNLSIVVDKRILIFGGQDITKNVVDLLSGVGDPVPPVNTPPPSDVGFVDQAQIDTIGKVKSAQDDFNKFQVDAQKSAQDKFKAAKTDADRTQILKDLQKSVQDKSDASIKPLVEKTRQVIADVAKKKNLILVIDRNNTVYGGVDITQDVVAALK